MRHFHRVTLAGLVAATPALAFAQQGGETPAAGPAGTLAVEVVADDFSRALYLTAPAGDPRLFVVEQGGRIMIVENGEVLPTPFLDLGRTVSQQGSERGLLGLAFHPDYAENGRFFVNYTGVADGATRVAEYRVSADNPNVADPGSGVELLRIAQPAANHNGGWLGFGPDGLLYISTGDGGGGNDQFRNGQNAGSLLAKILRIDVDGGGERGYAIPAGNPFPDAPEAWVMGLRNPWRVSFDGDDVYIADVGQNMWEEISVIGIDDAGANLGWNVMEGTHCFMASTCNGGGFVAPVYDYSHAATGGCSITGGYVYRGAAIPALAGHYLFSDWCAGFLRSFRYVDGAVTDLTDWSAQVGTIGQVTSFGVDGAGEVYLIAGTSVFRLVPGGPAGQPAAAVRSER